MASSIGAYKLQGELGRGGMGCVYRARHGPTGTVRALKVLTESSDPEAIVRFRREAEALARAGGDGVVGFHEAGVHEGHAYYVMDLMPGGSLRDRLRERGRLPWRDAVTLVAALADTLGRYHRAGLIHRDVKPENVLFAARDGEERPLLADFGCARDLGATRLTATGTLIGTPAYAAPEQLRGEPVGVAADVYALGVILQELVSGSRPYDANTLVELHRRIVAGDRRRLDAKGLPSGLDAVVARALAPRPRDRLPDGAALASELRDLLEGRQSGGAARPVLAGVLLAASVLVALVVAVVVGVRSMSGPDPGLATPSSSTGTGPVASRAGPAPGPDPHLEGAVASALAASDYERALGLVHADATWTRTALGALEAEVLLEAGDVEGARRLALEALGTDPREARALAVIASIRAMGKVNRAEDQDSAVAAATSAIACGDSARARLARAKALLERGKDAYGHAKKTGGSTLDAYEIESRAIEDLLKAVELRGPEHAIAPLLEEVYDQRQKLKDGDAKEDRRERDRWKDRARFLPRSEEVRLLAELRETARDNKAPKDRLMTLATDAIRISPRRAEAFAIRGRLRGEAVATMGEPDPVAVDEALADLETALRLDARAPRSRDLAMVYFMRAARYVKSGDSVAARSDLERGLAFDSTRSEAYIPYFTVLRRLGSESRARDLMLFAVASIRRGEIRGVDVPAVLRVGADVLAKYGDLDGCFDALRLAIEMSPDNCHLWASRARHHFDQGDVVAAWRDADRALALDPQWSMAVFSRAAARHQQGDLAGALADYERFLSLAAPGDDRVAPARSRIELLHRQLGR